jgi:hypothetical protein
MGWVGSSGCTARLEMAEITGRGWNSMVAKIQKVIKRFCRIQMITNTGSKSLATYKASRRHTSLLHTKRLHTERLYTNRLLNLPLLNKTSPRQNVFWKMYLDHVPYPVLVNGYVKCLNYREWALHPFVIKQC